MFKSSLKKSLNVIGDYQLLLSSLTMVVLNLCVYIFCFKFMCICVYIYSYDLELKEIKDEQFSQKNFL